VNTLLKAIVGWLTKRKRGETKISPQNCVLGNRVFDHYWLYMQSYMMMGASSSDNFVVRLISQKVILEQIRDDLKKTT
jgi:hypothetical protein